MAGRDIAQGGLLLPAAAVGERAARREAAAFRLVVGARPRGFDGGEPPAPDIEGGGRGGTLSAGCWGAPRAFGWWGAARARHRGAGSSRAGRSCRGAADRRT